MQDNPYKIFEFIRLDYDEQARLEREASMPRRHFNYSVAERENGWAVVEQDVDYPDEEHTRVAAVYPTEQEATSTAGHLQAGTYRQSWHRRARRTTAQHWWFKE